MIRKFFVSQYLCNEKKILASLLEYQLQLITISLHIFKLLFRFFLKFQIRKKCFENSELKSDYYFTLRATVQLLEQGKKVTFSILINAAFVRFCTCNLFNTSIDYNIRIT